MRQQKRALVNGITGQDGSYRDYQQRTGIEVRFYQTGSSEMYGLVQEVP